MTNILSNNNNRELSSARNNSFCVVPSHNGGGYGAHRRISQILSPDQMSCDRCTTNNRRESTKSERIVIEYFL